MQAKRSARLVAALGLAAALSACVQAPRQQYPGGYPNQPQSYPNYPQQQYPQQGQPGYPSYPPSAQAPQGVEYGYVANIEVLNAQAPRGGSSGIGAILGAVVGGVVGNQIGGGFGRAAATAAGAVGGAVAGNAIEQSQTPRYQQQQGYRIVINLQNGGQRIYDVPHPGDLRQGDRVQINQGQISRY
ncbi:glycine zipper 2TM domain-containing protein [Comamonas humi]